MSLIKLNSPPPPGLLRPFIHSLNAGPASFKQYGTDADGNGVVTYYDTQGIPIASESTDMVIKGVYLPLVGSSAFSVRKCLGGARSR